MCLCLSVSLFSLLCLCLYLFFAFSVVLPLPLLSLGGCRDRKLYINFQFRKQCSVWYFHTYLSHRKAWAGININEAFPNVRKVRFSVLRLWQGSSGYLYLGPTGPSGQPLALPWTLLKTTPSLPYPAPLGCGAQAPAPHRGQRCQRISPWMDTAGCLESFPKAWIRAPVSAWAGSSPGMRIETTLVMLEPM